MDTAPKTIVVGMSGGVDSSVSAYLLQQQGYEVIGLFMKNWEEDDTQSYCAAENDVKDAQHVCDKLGIPLHTVNFAYEYWERVFSNFISEFEAGRTPNPDILCNREIKFKEFLFHAHSLGANLIATGHYARHISTDDHHYLYKGIDENKDQSYFLYSIDNQALSEVIFPLGELTKTQVREIAKKLAFSNHDKKDSTGICFIGERKFKEFLARYLKPNPGDILGPDDNIVGRHQGLMYYTIGQRYGLGIGGKGEAWYVAKKDLENNVLYAVQGHDHPMLYTQYVEVIDTSFFNSVSSDDYFCTAKTRYRQKDQSCQLIQVEANRLQVKFKQAQRAITPGQSIVFYNDQQCLGGGIIHSSF